MEKKILLKGIGASQGIVQGKARVILPGESLADFKEEEILVTTLTDPTMVIAMVKAAGIITDLGGITSHPAILSREMGIPCVVNTKDSTKKIINGQTILIDGQKGEVYVLG